MKNIKIIKYKRPRRGLYIWQSNIKNSRRKSISNKLAIYYKVSKSKSYRDIFPQINNLLKIVNIQKELDLNEDEIEWVNKI